MDSGCHDRFDSVRLYRRCDRGVGPGARGVQPDDLWHRHAGRHADDRGHCRHCRPRWAEEGRRSSIPPAWPRSAARRSAAAAARQRAAGRCGQLAQRPRRAGQAHQGAGCRPREVLRRPKQQDSSRVPRSGLPPAARGQTPPPRAGRTRRLPRRVFAVPTWRTARRSRTHGRKSCLPRPRARLPSMRTASRSAAISPIRPATIASRIPMLRSCSTTSRPPRRSGSGPGSEPRARS